MYWPIGTPRIYAATTNTKTNSNTNKSRASARSNPPTNVVVSHDGASTGSDTKNGVGDEDGDGDGDGDDDNADVHDRLLGKADTPSIGKGFAHNLDVPITPGLKTPVTPAVNSVDHDQFNDASSEGLQQGLAGLGITNPSAAGIPIGEPILALTVSRTGHLFAVITSTTMTIWQTKVRSPPAVCNLASL